MIKNVYCSVLLLLLPGWTNGAPEEIAELRALVTALQSEVHALRSEVLNLKGGETAPPETVRSAPSTREASPVAITGPASAAVEKPALRSKFAVELYGYVKADFFHDSGVLSHQEIPYWVQGDASGEGSLDFTARQSRFGLDVSVPESVLGGKVTGKMELDFFAGAPTPSSMSGGYAYGVRSRHVYFQWKSPAWSVIAGKTWDAYILKQPDTLNFAYYNFQGQIGFRRMQIFATRKVDLRKGHRVELTAGLGEPFGGLHGGDIDGDCIDDGADAELPALALKARYIFPGVADRSSSIGISALFQREEVELDTFDGWAVMFGGELPLANWLTLSGVIWTGENLDCAFGGVGQGINTLLWEAIPAYGGWTQLRVQFHPRSWFNIGYSIDNPSDRYLNSGHRTYNKSYLVNAYFQLASPLLLGLEYFQTETGYLGNGVYRNHRLQSSLIFKF